MEGESSVSIQRQTQTPRAQGNAGTTQLGFDLAPKALSPVEHFTRRLSQHRVSIEPAPRTAADIRALILVAGLEAVIIGRAPNRGPESYAQCFERLFFEPLEPPKRKGK